jgi:hypothetical protein
MSRVVVIGPDARDDPYVAVREELMRGAKLFVVAAAALLIASCGPALTLNPLFEDSELVFDPALLGGWGDGQTSMTFERGDGKTYKVTYRDGTKVSVLVAKLGRLDGRMFLDIYPVDNQDDQSEKEAYAPRIPMHTVIRVGVDDDQLVLDTLDEDWVKKQADEDGIELDADHVLKAGDGLFVTLSTKDLQDFISNHAYDDEAFPPSDPLPRIE